MKSDVFQIILNKKVFEKMAHHYYYKKDKDNIYCLTKYNWWQRLKNKIWKKR